MNYDWNFSVFWSYREAFLRGTWVTIKLSILSTVVGTLIGFALGAAYRLLPFRKILLFLNDIARAIPLLVLLFFFYYFPFFQLLHIKPPTAFICAMIAMSFSQAVFTADIVYAAVDGVPQRIVQGARSLGLKEGTIWRYIIIPDIFRQILPSLIAFAIGIVKLSSFASVIGCEDVVFVTRIATGQTFRSLEGWIIVALIYVILVVPLTVFARQFEGSKWLKRRF